MCGQAAGDQQLGADPLSGVDLGKHSDYEVAELLGVHGDHDGAVEQIPGELDRRKAVANAAAARREADRERRIHAKQQQREKQQWMQFEQLLERGHDEESAVAEVFGRSVEQQRRDRAIASLRHQGYPTRGSTSWRTRRTETTCTRSTSRPRTPPAGTWSPPQGGRAGSIRARCSPAPEARAQRWTSDELKEWWDENGRVTFEQYKNDLLGNTPTTGDPAETDSSDEHTSSTST